MFTKCCDTPLYARIEHVSLLKTTGHFSLLRTIGHFSLLEMIHACLKRVLSAEHQALKVQTGLYVSDRVGQNKLPSGHTEQFVHIRCAGG